MPSLNEWSVDSNHMSTLQDYLQVYASNILHLILLPHVCPTINCLLVTFLSPADITFLVQDLAALPTHLPRYPLFLIYIDTHYFLSLI